MSHWNYRLIRHRDERSEETILCIHEVYYNQKGGPESYTENGSVISSERTEGIEWTLHKMREALDKPILEAGDFA